jgi:hypothetical protein
MRKRIGYRNATIRGRKDRIAGREQQMWGSIEPHFLSNVHRKGLNYQNASSNGVKLRGADNGISYIKLPSMSNIFGPSLSCESCMPVRFEERRTRLNPSCLTAPYPTRDISHVILQFTLMLQYRTSNLT